MLTVCQHADEKKPRRRSAQAVSEGISNCSRVEEGGLRLSLFRLPFNAKVVAQPDTIRQGVRAGEAEAGRGAAVKALFEN